MYCSSILCIDTFENSLTICISNDKTIYSVGFSEFGSHGHENKEIFPIKQIPELTNIKMIDCGDSHTICLNYDGNIFSFGKNNKGQLGINKDYNELKQTYIPHKIDLPLCKYVSCGYDFTMCLSNDNNLYSFGDNVFGELGLGNNEYYNSPQLVSDLNNIEFIECNADHSICKTYDNQYYSWGSNDYGELGQGNNYECNKPIQCLNWPDNIINIKCGSYHSLLLTSEGQVYSFGLNSSGQLGINDRKVELINIPALITDIPKIQRIESGHYHSICIDINNNLWLFGANSYGQLGLGDNNCRYKPVIHPILSDIIDISSRGFHTFVKTIDNKIYAFGRNNHSQLGIKTSEEQQLTPIQVFKDKEDIWCSFIGKSRAKSARK